MRRTFSDPKQTATGRSPESSAVNGFLQRLARLESWDPRSLDFDGCASLRVATRARRTILDGKRAKANQGNRFPILQRTGNRFQQSVDRTTSRSLGEICCISYHIYEFSLVQACLPLLSR